MPSRFEKANAVRALAMDAVQKAKSGHPGMPMGMADIAEVLWSDYLQVAPADPNWINRDRFVISNGHGSMLQYALLHLTGFALSIDDLKNFRQLHSKTPGHPELGYTPGVETTTGPLGQGLANAVGMALAEKVLAAQFNRPGLDVINHHTYVFLGDGCLMEGISHEVASLAGTWALGKLICFYDDNGISIDGEVEGWFNDDTAKRFDAYGWQVIPHVNGHDPVEIKQAIETARAEQQRPTLICCRTVIGFGAPTKAGKEECHGSPLGETEVAGAREKLGWHHAPFEIPEDIYQAWDLRSKGQQRLAQWQQILASYRINYPALAYELERRMSGDLPIDFIAHADKFIAETNLKAANIASRKASENSINAYAPLLPELLGGSADLAGSNLTLWKGAKGIDAEDASGNYLYYGVREFGMSAIMNGLGLHGGFIPYGGTFLIFMEYARNAVRMAALMKLRSLFVYTHDSIGLGEDGPTHQPIEQLNNLRGTPNTSVWRPCDSVEAAVAWKQALLKQDGPSALIFSRQALPHQHRTEKQIKAIERGAYILVDCQGTPDLILIATGSEVQLAVSAASQLSEAGKKIRVVSMPSTTVFDTQSAEYKEQLLPASVRKRIAIEAGHTDFWWKYVGLDGQVIGMHSFGESAPADALFKHFNISVEKIVHSAQELR